MSQNFYLQYESNKETISFVVCSLQIYSNCFEKAIYNYGGGDDGDNKH
jgi:hypothetical protein